MFTQYKQSITAGCLVCCFIAIALSCEILIPEEPRNLINNQTAPPQVLSVQTIGPKEILLTFDSPVHTEKHLVSIIDGHGISDITTKGNSLSVHIHRPIPPGEQRMMEGVFRDASNNQLSLIAPVYGYNPRPAEVLINEFTTRGNESHPDRVELLVTSSGNTAGLTFYDGVQDTYRQRKILPGIEAEKGDYIIIHCRSYTCEAEDETDDPSSSDAPGSHKNAWDVFIPDGIGLSSNNGVLTVYDSPGGTLINGLFYSNRTSDSDERYRGFGSRVMLEKTMALCREGGWDAPAETVAPEDGVCSALSTATRSMCRKLYSNTNSRNDWIVVPTRGSTFGFKNTQEEYHPDT